MAEQIRTSVRVLVVDDETDIRDAYRQILLETEVSQDIAGFRELRARLFAKSAPPAAQVRSLAPGATFDPVFCEQAEAAVAAVREALAQERPFAVVFLDMRMPPSHDGVWAATKIREIDPAIEIVICTAYSDVDPCEIGALCRRRISFHIYKSRFIRTKCGKWPLRLAVNGVPSGA